MSSAVSAQPRSGLMVLLANTALALILAQFALAGAALFVSSSLWAIHGAIGATTGLPIGAMLWHTRRSAAAFALRRPSLALFVVYVVQFGLAAISDGPGLGLVRAVHVANAALVLAASFYVALQSARLQRLP